MALWNSLFCILSLVKWVKKVKMIKIISVKLCVLSASVLKKHLKRNN